PVFSLRTGRNSQTGRKSAQLTAEKSCSINNLQLGRRARRLAASREQISARQGIGRGMQAESPSPSAALVTISTALVTMSLYTLRFCCQDGDADALPTRGSG